jgi:hypothetical protein
MALVSLQVAIKIIDMTEIRAEYLIRNQDREKEEERQRERRTSWKGLLTTT